MRIKRRTQKPIHEVFNDGFLAYGYDKTIRESGKRVGSEFTKEGTLAVQELSARDKDYKMAGVMSSVLDLKLKTLKPPFWKNSKTTNMKVVYQNDKYDVIKADSDRRYLYFYLQLVGESSE